MNERKTEQIVRKLLEKNGYSSDDNVLIEEQSSDNPKIDKLLKSASKSGDGKGYPEFIISFHSNPDNLVVIECKADISKHESLDRKKYKDYAVDGVLLYAAYLKDEFNVMAIAVSGETDRELKISHFLWLKQKHIYRDVSDKHILNPESLFGLITEHSKPVREEELIKSAIKYNKNLHDYSIPEVERCAYISSILVALQDPAFLQSYKAHHTFKGAHYNPNKSLITSLLQSCDNILTRNGISQEKRKTILGEYRKIEQNNILNKPTIKDKKTHVETTNTLLRDLIDDISSNVLPYVNQGWFDVLGKFYTQFIRYAGSDKKTGLVLTPPHITDFFCDISNVNKNDTVFDPCCGTGGFLVSAMSRMLSEVGNNEDKRQLIRSNQVIGIERRADMFSHACSNMMMRGDGKSHIYFGDCFDDSLKEQVKNESPTKIFLNPPYDVGPDGQLKFIENAMECFGAGGGICVAICQMSSVLNGDNAVMQAKERLLERHTLLAVMSMPADLFYPIGVVTAIIVLVTNQPHPDNMETFFGYFKDDGFVKAKNKGRINKNQLWSGIKAQWLDTYINRKSVPGLSVMKSVNAGDEWCAEAYMTTDYSNLTDEDFIKTIKDYVVYKFMQEKPPYEPD